MKVEWEYEGKKYVIYDDRDGNLYLNCHLCDCAEILRDIQDPNGKIVRQAKRKAKELLLLLVEEKAKEKIRKAKILEDAEKSRIKSERITNILGNALVFILISILICLIIYLIYQVWWFFIGYDAFEGPFADQYSSGETTADTIILFIVLIVVIEEVVRRIRNGHF